jgi:DNA (cytosine-5)-methyltransferase 1
MIKIGTVFSGIGAIEHALYRMGMSHKIVFACDNGEVDIFSKKINVNKNEIINELSLLENEINLFLKSTSFKKISVYSDQLNELLSDLRVISYKTKQLSANSIEGKDAQLNNKSLKDYADRTAMFYERFGSIKVLIALAKMKSFSEKKAFIDQLYSKKANSNKVRQSYMANYNLSEKHFHWNASFLDGSQYSNSIDLFVGGSPCQSFSLVGKKRGLEDTRGTLFYEYARLVKEIKPKVFIYENVRAVLSNDNGRTWETMKQVFNELNYDWQWKLLNSKDFGIPQSRERLFVVGFRKDVKLKKTFTFPEKIPLKLTMQDFLEDVTEGKYYLPEKGVAFVTNEKNLKKGFTQIDGIISLCQTKNQQFNWHGDFVFVENDPLYKSTTENVNKYFLSTKVEKYVLANGTKSFYSKPQTDLKIARPLLQSMHKMHRAGVDNYITRSGRLRKLTPRECLRLMGFSDTFKIVVSDTSIYKQAGNSIVVDVLIQLITQIKKSYNIFK